MCILSIDIIRTNVYTITIDKPTGQGTTPGTRKGNIMYNIIVQFFGRKEPILYTSNILPLLKADSSVAWIVREDTGECLYMR